MNGVHIMPTLVEATTGGDLVSNLLTGGGFVFLAAVMGGLALWNKNQSESAKSIAEGSREFVEGAREELMSIRADAAQARASAVSALAAAAVARSELDALLEERRIHTRNLKRQNSINAEHKAWDEELLAEVARLGGTVRRIPPLATCSVDDPGELP